MFGRLLIVAGATLILGGCAPKIVTQAKPGTEVIYVEKSGVYKGTVGPDGRIPSLSR